MAEHEYLKSGYVAGNPIGVDHENKIINGWIVAEVGEFRTGRGEFDREALAGIVNLINAAPDGIVSNYGHHPQVGTPEALDAFLGRKKNARLDGDRARVDLHFNPVAFMSATGGVSRGERLMMRAETDPGSFGSSLVVAVDKRPRNGKSPLWRPLAIQSSDVVYIGDAVHGGILSADDSEWQDEELRLRWRNMQRKLS